MMERLVCALERIALALEHLFAYRRWCSKEFDDYMTEKEKQVEGK